tara:strand:+ start:254 stop:1003 length:750 start_codon:yes stop_codon:yes gene_type:complete
MSKKLKILKMIDKNEKYNIKHPLFDVVFSLLVVGKSQLSGKTNILGALLLQDVKDGGYKGIFQGENIYLVSGSMNTDYKLKVIKSELSIPDNNVIEEYDEKYISDIYNMIQDEYLEAVQNKEKPVNSLIIFDDMSFGGSLKKRHSIIQKIFCNGRHIGLSVIITTQSYVDLLTACRENSKGLILFDMSDRQLERVMDDHNNIGKKKFRKMFREVASKKKHSFLVINYSADTLKDRFLDSDFNVIDTDKL